MDTRRWLAAAWLLAAAQAATAQQPDARAATGARPARAGAPMPPPYGPVLYVNGKPVQDTGPRNPAEVQDEADTGANPAAQPAAPHSQPQQQRGKQQVRRRRPAWQAGTEPMAPRPLHGDQDTAGQGVPIPPPAAAPRPVVPSSSAVIGCQGSACTDTSGNMSHSVVGGNTGVNSSGRLCTRTGTTVQCF